MIMDLLLNSVLTPFLAFIKSSLESVSNVLDLTQLNGAISWLLRYDKFLPVSDALVFLLGLSLLVAVMLTVKLVMWLINTIVP